MSGQPQTAQSDWSPTFMGLQRLLPGTLRSCGLAGVDSEISTELSATTQKGGVLSLLCDSSPVYVPRIEGSLT